MLLKAILLVLEFASCLAAMSQSARWKSVSNNSTFCKAACLSICGSESDLDGGNFGGISAIDYDSTTNMLILLPDYSGLGTCVPRFYKAKLFVDEKLICFQLILPPTRLQDPYYASGVNYNAEALRIDRVNGDLIWISEACQSCSKIPRPTIRCNTPDGKASKVGNIKIEEYGFTGQAGTIVNNNTSFEGLVFHDGYIYISVEGSTLGDPDNLRRIIHLDERSDFKTPTTYYYPLEKQWYISEILNCGDDLFILERKWESGDYNSMIRLCTAKFKKNKSMLARTEIIDFNKELLEVNSHIDNIEGLCWGPILSNGHRTLILISDDNRQFNKKPPGNQETQLWMLELKN